MMESNDSIILPAGKTLQGGKYKILKTLGQGGFGITYLAEQTGLGMKVAIKEFFLKGSCLRNADTSEVSVPVTDNKEIVSKCLKKFKSEAKKIASLNNDHIVNIIDVFDENGTAYYVMKYLRNGSLANKVNGNPLSESQALTVIREMCDALNSIHNNGLLHLDIKPANILFDERYRAVLIDFGVSKYVDSDKDTATTSSLVGFSRGYAPLEQINASGATLTPASDIYALGATLYCLVTGETPPEASSVMDSGLPTLPASLSQETKNAIIQAMQPRRSNRPQDIPSFLSLLPEERTLQEEEESTVLQVGKRPKASPVPASKSSKLPLILSAAMLIAAIVLFIATFTPKKQGNAAITQQQYQTVVHEKDSLQNRVKRLQSDYNSQKKQNDELSKTNSALQTTNKKLQSDNQTLKNQLQEERARTKRALGID